MTQGWVGGLTPQLKCLPDPGQLEHRHPRLAEYGQQLDVGADRALIGRVLQVLFLDVVP